MHFALIQPAEVLYGGHAGAEPIRIVYPRVERQRERMPKVQLKNGRVAAAASPLEYATGFLACRFRRPVCLVRTSLHSNFLPAQAPFPVLFAASHFSLLAYRLVWQPGGTGAVRLLPDSPMADGK
jgi:hypothetical protein